MLSKFLLFLLLLSGLCAICEVLHQGIMYIQLWWFERTVDKEIKRRQEFKRKYQTYKSQ